MCSPANEQVFEPDPLGTTALSVRRGREAAQAKSPGGWLPRNRGVSRDAVLAHYDLSECNHSARIENKGVKEMAKAPKNHRQPWTTADNRELKKLIKENTPTRVMGIKLGRTAGAVQQHASESGLSTKPTNQSRYNRRTKR